MSDFASLLETLLKNRVGSMSQTASAPKPNMLQAPYNPAAQYAPPVEMNTLFGKGGSLSSKGGGSSGGGGILGGGT